MKQRKDFRQLDNELAKVKDYISKIEKNSSTHPYVPKYEEYLIFLILAGLGKVQKLINLRQFKNDFTLDAECTVGQYRC